MAVLAAACSPTLDWREVRPAGSTAVALFPCKPASHARRVPLGGPTVEMTLYACSAADATYAVAFADVADPARVGPALDELARAAQAHLGPGASAASTAASVPGMTPHPRAARWQLQGRLPDGRAVGEQVALFSHGTFVYQATVVGERLDAQALDVFFGSLRVKP